MKDTLADVTLASIKRIQNNWLWEKYIQHRQRMRVKNADRINEKKLFHGTRETDPAEIYLSEEGFDMRFSSSGLWGRGNYFATKASYSDMYAHKVAGGEKQIFLVLVLTGDSARCEKSRELTMPPLKDGTKSDIGKLRYDTVTGVTKDTRVYITYSNEKAYPAYLISYRDRPTNPVGLSRDPFHRPGNPVGLSLSHRARSHAPVFASSHSYLPGSLSQIPARRSTGARGLSANFSGLV